MTLSTAAHNDGPIVEAVEQERPKRLPLRVCLFAWFGFSALLWAAIVLAVFS